MKGAIYVWERDMLLWFGGALFLIMASIEPMAYLALFALSMQGVVPSVEYGGRLISYVTFVTISVAVTNAFASGTHAGFQIFIENLLGTGELLLVSPLKRYELVLGRLLSALSQTLLMSLSALIMGVLIGAELQLSLQSLFFALVVLSLCAISFGGVGLLICSKITTSRAYNIIINAIQLPTIFSSSAFYPKTALPYSLLLLASVNPLSYAADSLRDIFVLGRVFPTCRVTESMSMIVD